MDKKNLPIGTVCDIGTSSKKVMIIGYVAIEYENDLIKHDYYGCSYPQGISGLNNIFAFDAIDIENIYFTGYQTEESNKILKKIPLINVELKTEEISNDLPSYNNQENIAETVIETKKPIVSNGFIFDEDGYIIKEDPEKLKNPFVQNNVSKTEDTKKENKWDIFKNIQFDENGFVVAEGTNFSIDEVNEQPIVIPEHNDEIISDVEAKTIPNNLNKIRFDENGFVVADGSTEVSSVNVPSNLEKFGKIKFDENGTVIEDGNEPSVVSPTIPEKFSGIKFDENGTVIAEGNETNNNNTSNSERFNKIRFDENGFIVQE